MRRCESQHRKLLQQEAAIRTLHRKLADLQGDLTSSQDQVRAHEEQVRVERELLVSELAYCKRMLAEKDQRYKYIHTYIHIHTHTYIHT